MLMKVFSLILAAVMSFSSIPVTSNTALKITDAVNNVIGWVSDALSNSDAADENSATLPENGTSTPADTSEREDFEVSEQAMNDERDPTDGMTLKFYVNGTYKREDAWGHVETEANCDTYFEVDGLHAVSNSSAVTVGFSKGDGEGGNYNFGTRGTGLTGTFYHDVNAKNDIGKNYGVTDFSSLSIYAQNKGGGYVTNKTVKISSSSYTFTPSTLTIPKNNSSDYAEPSFSSSSAASGTSQTVAYSLSIATHHKDESHVDTLAGTSFSIKYVHVSTFALWNLYASEANTGAGTSKRASYKASYTAADASAWNKYEEALVSARKILCGGVPQSTIDAEYNNLRAAVMNLKIRCQFKTTDCTNSVAPYYFTVKLFSDVTAQNDRAFVQATYTYNTITPTTPAGCWLDAEKLERTGYAFKQWKRFRSYNSSTVLFDNAGENAKYQFILQDTYTTPVVFEPTWEALTYTIYFDASLPTDNGFFGELMGGVDTKPITITWEDQTQVYPSCMWLVHKELENGEIMYNYMKFRAWSTIPGSAAEYTNLPGNLIYASDFFDGSKNEVREITLYALWKNNVGSVTLDFNYSGTISDIKDYQMKPLTSRTVFKTMVLNTTWALNVNPYAVFYREGYDFTGWHTDPDMPSLCNAATPTDENPEITLYAQWTKKSFYINLDVNSGSLTNEYQTWLNNVVDGQDIIKIDDRILRVIYGTRFNLPGADCVTRVGYSFYAWELNGVEYQPGAQVAIPDYGQTGTTIQLKAIWQRNTTSFTLHYNNGQPDQTFSGLYQDPVPEVHAVKFIPDTTGMNDFHATANSWYTRVENADGTYTYTPYRQTTSFPAESVELYCGWSMKRLTQAVCNDCNGKMGMSDYVRVNKDTKSLDFLFLERSPDLYPEGRLYYYTEESRNVLVDAFNVAKEYITDFSPNSTKNLMFDYSLKEEIEQAAVGIYDALNQMAFNPADYSKVEAQIERINQIREGTFTYDKSEPPTENCGINTFTAQTWRQVELAEGKIKYDYNTTQQAAVDIFASNIDEAISGLILKSDVEDWTPLVEVLNEFAKSFTELEDVKETITLKGTEYFLEVSKKNTDGSKVFYESYDQELLQLADEYFRSARELLTDSVDPSTFDLDETVAVLYDLINEIKSTEAGGAYDKIINLWNQYLSSNTAQYKLEFRQAFVNAYKAVDWTLTDSQQDIIDGYYNEMNRIWGQMTTSSNFDKFEVIVDDGKDDGENVEEQNLVLNLTYGTKIIDLLETPVRNGYKFGGWFIDENCTMPLDDMVATYDVQVYALWLEDTPRFEVEVYIDGNGAVSINNGKSEFEDFVKVFDKNTNILLTANPLSGYKFIGWMDMNSGKVVSVTATISTTLVSDYRLIAMFTPVSEDTFTVIFKDKNGVVVDKQEVASGDSAVAPDMSYFYYDGYVFDGWDKDFSKVSGDMTVNAVYIRTADFYTVTVSGGTVNGLINLDAVKYNTKLIVTVDETAIPEGMVFAGWSIDNGKTIVSYAETYTFYVITKTNLNAVYAEAVNEVPTISLSAIINGNKLSFVSERSLPDYRYTFIESGILLTTEAQLADKLTLENASDYDAIKHGKTASTEADGQYKVTLNATPNREYFAVSYLAYVDKYGEIKVIYTDLYSVVI
ncbi:MAG: InlB B-repeat-containing protein [Clostridia bacterium]|nr:InlB B-repeat-containing protein [Clostridia bacterium]